MSEIKEKLEGELRSVKALYETMENAIKSQIDKGLDKVNTHELYEASDILKDLGEIKLNCVKAMYYEQILEAMEKEENEEKEEDRYMLQRMKEDYGEEEGQRYYNEYRYANGRYAPKGRGRRRRYTEPRYLTAPEVMPVMPDAMPVVEPVAYYRDMDRETMNKMYYGMGGSSGIRGGSGSRGYSDMRGESNRSNVRSYEDGYSEGNTRGYEDGYSKGDSDGYNRGFSEGRRNSGGGRYERARRNYEETKMNKTGNQQEDAQKEMKELEKTLNAFESELTELLPKMSQSEKNLVKNKVVSWQNKV